MENKTPLYRRIAIAVFESSLVSITVGITICLCQFHCGTNKPKCHCDQIPSIKKETK
jgi:hypothetical protein